jgi:hypothetical protein
MIMIWLDSARMSGISEDRETKNPLKNTHFPLASQGLSKPLID